MKRNNPMAWTIVLCLTLFASAPALADGLQNVGTYHDGNSEFVIDSYSKGAVTVGLIGLDDNNLKVSYAFDKTDWPAFYRLWQKARAMSSDKLQTAGSVTETGSATLCIVALAGGPGIRITIVDPTRGAVTVLLQPSDVDAFEANLLSVAGTLTVSN